jgi:anti-sigma regulatory factor (Ser/Thr protein kinase)
LLELSLHILDLLRNSIEAGANQIQLLIEEDPAADWVTIEISDNGRGMNPKQVEKVLDPFFTTRKTRRVGLGLSLFAAAARQCGGDLKIQAEPGKGTKVSATFQLSHWDRAPLGDIVGTLLTIIFAGPQVDLDYCHKRGGEAFHFNTTEIRAELGEIPLDHPKVRDWITAALKEGESELNKMSLKPNAQVIPSG